MALTAGGGVGVAAAVLVLWSHVDLSTGTDALATPLCAAGVFQLVAALAAALTLGDQLNSLPAVFGATACKSATSSCAAATAARRFALANTPVAPLWVSALGHLALGFPPSSRLKQVHQRPACLFRTREGLRDTVDQIGRVNGLGRRNDCGDARVRSMPRR